MDKSRTFISNFSWKKKLTLVLLPFVVYYVWPTFVLLSTGEFFNLNSIRRAALQSAKEGKKFLFASAIAKNAVFYKLFSVEYKPKLDLMIMGSSRGRPIPKVLFQDHLRFFNASAENFNITNYLSFLNYLQEKNKLPKAIFLALDFVDFGDIICKSQTNNQNDILKTFPVVDPLWLIQTQSFPIWVETWNDKLRFSEIFQATFKSYPQGLFPFREIRGGYRHDGSYKPANVRETRSYLAARVKLQNELKQISAGTLGYPQGSALDLKCLEPLNQVLEIAKKNQIDVVGYLTPNPPTVQQYYDEDIGKYGYQKGLSAELEKIFTAYGYPYFNATYADSFGATDQEAYDFAHMGPVTYAKSFIQMVYENPQLQTSYFKTAAEYSDLISKAPNAYTLIPEETEYSDF